MTRVLMVLSAADHWTLTDGTKHPTGGWAEEFVVPYETFSDAGWDIVVATPGGRAPTVDRLSLGIAGGSPARRRRLEARLGELAPSWQIPRGSWPTSAPDRRADPSLVGPSVRPALAALHPGAIGPILARWR